MDALKEAIIAYNVKAPVKYLSSFEGLPGTGYNDETDNNAYRYKWNSETLSFPTPVKKLRFKVLETNTKDGKMVTNSSRLVSSECLMPVVMQCR